MIKENDTLKIDEYFQFLSFSQPSYRYQQENDLLRLFLDNRTYDFSILIKQKETDEEKENVKMDENSSKIPVANPDNRNTVSNTDQPEIRKEENKDYFKILSSYYSFSEGTDISSIIAKLGSAIDTNQKLIVDFSELNPNEKGKYKVIFSSENNRAEITVEII